MDIADLLTETKDLTLPYFDFPEIDLTKTYAEGKWTIKKILVHLADAEAVLQERIKRVIAEPRQVIWAFNQDLWCDQLEYETFPIALSKAIYESNRYSVLYLAKKYYNKLGHKEFIHSETGIRTLKDEFDKIAFHNQHHLRQIERAVENNFRTPMGYTSSA